MKKYLFFATFTAVAVISTSFTTSIVPKAKQNPAPTFACIKPQFTSVTTSGSYTTFVWDDTSPQHVYKFGGTYSSGGGFSYCVIGTNSITIPYNGGGTARVRDICQGTCDNATESSDPSDPYLF